MRFNRLSRIALSCGAVALVASGCSTPAEGEEAIELTMNVDADPNTVAAAENLAEGFTEKNPNITISVESRPGGNEGDNIVRTRLSTGEMSDIFQHNAGSLLRAVSPETTMLPIEDQSVIDGLDDTFVEAVTVEGQAYGVPSDAMGGGGIYYNKSIYEELGLSVPLTWDEFMENNKVIKEAGYDPVIQSFAAPDSAQIINLADFHNVSYDNPDFADDFTANKAKFATDPDALQSFQKMADLAEADFFNEDAPATEGAGALEKFANGEGAHITGLTGTITGIQETYPDQIDNLGFFAVPGDTPEGNGLTVWAPTAYYVADSTDYPEEAMEFLKFAGSAEGCELMQEAAVFAGPPAVDGCEVPDDAPGVVQDVKNYFDEGNNSLALEFLSPVKGPNLASILVQVGTGQVDAETAAADYDLDVEKQAQQLGLEGW